MKVICKTNTGKNISRKALSIGNTVGTEFGLDIGSTYVVYGMCIWMEVLHYLITGNATLPSWYPAEIFDVKDTRLPLEWYFTYDASSSLSAIWGYKELVLDKNHYEGLIERESDDVKLFLTRKEEIDNDV